ncbi:hypothetical protein DFH07DRAFT_776652 [Mycena maculata]|uniref:Uncharacterized protein n=1 Tax=Mycena maculata TaxID=230809 RepID=A0AAD7ILF0_9AGAR|nr:hypothetical protein DFH07DRAFT_776652 [Mycena maculata]
MAERPYIESDFNSLRKREDYVALIKRQLSKFPLPAGKLAKINIKDMKTMLMDLTLGFTMLVDEESLLDGNPQNSASQVSTLEHIAQPSLPDSQLPTKAIQLLIEDIRSTSSDTKISQRILVKLVDMVDCLDGEWSRIGIPDHVSSGYTEFFASFHDDEANFAPNLTYLVVPKENRLKLTIRPLKREHSPPSERVNTVQTLVPVSSSSATQDVAEKEPLDTGVKSLLFQIQKRPDFAKFHSNRGRILQNAERVEYWRFAAQVADIYVRTSWPPEIHSIKKISRLSIQKALDIGSTSLTDTINMTRIIDLYTADGPNRSEKVISEVNKSQEENVPGATVLKSFLQKWETDHPRIVDNI